MENELMGTVDLILLEADAVVPNENEEAAIGEETPPTHLELLKPEGSRVKIYLDFDNFFVVLYPVVYLGPDEYHINYRRTRKDTSIDRRTLEVENFMSSLQGFLRNYQIRPSKYFPTLLTMPTVYMDDVLDFLLKAVSQLMKFATIYYTSNFKRIMIRRSLKMTISCASCSIEEYLAFDFAFDTSISPAELTEMIEALNKKDELRFYQLRTGGFVDLRAEKVLETLLFLQKFGVTSQDLNNRTIKIPKCEIPYAASLLEQAEAKQAVDISGINLKSLEQRIFEIRDRNILIPQTLKGELRPYQQDGYRWLKTLLWAGLGGILADDMGLGKTLQTIALILSVLEEQGTVKTLVVVPTSLIDNWMSELTRFAPSLKCVAVTGVTEKRSELFDSWQDYHVFITSYGLVVNDIKAYEQKMFDILILDEAQKIKNHRSKTAIEVRNIKAVHKFALTGTPVENNLAELWSIFNWLMPPLLKDFAAFKRKYINISENMDELKARIRPFMLRRMKKDVLEDLPEKIETTIKIELSDQQKNLYLAYREQALQMLQDPTQIMNVLAKLTRLRQICCHPGMFMEDYRESTGKLEALLEIISELKEAGRRVLVFSQFTSMLNIIEGELNNNRIEYCRLDGGTPQKRRSKIIGDFTEGQATVFLISLKAGGIGLNLTAADTVIHCDPWWNPSVEEQASARVYRIGQKKCVQIIYLIAKGTIEEKINDVKQQKQALIEKLISPGEELLTTLSAQELRQLLI